MGKSWPTPGLLQPYSIQLYRILATHRIHPAVHPCPWVLLGVAKRQLQQLLRIYEPCEQPVAVLGIDSTAAVQTMYAALQIYSVLTIA
eukprot:COSAG01_NODE_29319_length_640_cov_1.341959_1_plen_87_part_01